ncbi:MAG TPA: hypothetical protein VHD63_27710 [Ktedonobacteraceae bacterium]|nr:hypothetical protein [Ktedonobacteraceae bacterium]
MFEDFSQPLGTPWTQTTFGTGSLALVDSALRMSLAETPPGRYSDAQIDDYGQLARARFPWRPPLRMEIEARASLPAARADSTPTSAVLRGTAGFGFWNYPFSVRGDILMLPEAVWFFYAAPPSNMALVPGVPGWGWKAQVVHAMRPGALLATVPMALSASLARLSGLHRPAERWMQRLSGAQEALLPVELTSWQRYSLEWHAQEALFFVNGELVLRAPNPPTRPLGFVAWLDNQFAIATPRGVLRFGAVSTAAQWFEVTRLRIEAL